MWGDVGRCGRYGERDSSQAVPSARWRARGVPGIHLHTSLSEPIRMPTHRLLPKQLSPQHALAGSHIGDRDGVAAPAVLLAVWVVVVLLAEAAVVVVAPALAALVLAPISLLGSDAASVSEVGERRQQGQRAAKHVAVSTATDARTRFVRE